MKALNRDIYGDDYADDDGMPPIQVGFVSSNVTPKFARKDDEGEVQLSKSGLPVDQAARREWEIWTFMMEYFPDAFLEVLRVAILGNKQHNPGEKLHWARDKSADQMNTAIRHAWDHGRGVIFDVDGTYHLAKAIWRFSAELQLTIERRRAKAV